MKAVEEVAVPPETSAGWVSRLFFFWVVPFMRDALRQIREDEFGVESLPPTPRCEDPVVNIERLRGIWDGMLARRGKKASFFSAVCGFMRNTLLVCIGLMWLSAVLNMCVPVLVYFVIRAIQGLESPETGFATVGGMLGLSILASSLQQIAWHISTRCARQVWQALTGMVFEKPARLSAGARADLTEGTLVNLMTTDAPAVLNYMQFFSLFSTCPIYIMVPSVLLPLVLGWPYFVGLAALVVGSVLADRIASKAQGIQRAKMKAADGRAMVLNEAFQGIRTVKLNGWEELMEKRVEKERACELRRTLEYQIWTAIQQTLGFGMPTAAMVITFALYAWRGGELDPSSVFMSVGLFEYLGIGTSIVPNMFNTYRQVRLSMERMERLMIKKDDFVHSGSASGGEQALQAGAVRCASADFSWASDDSPEAPTLSAMSMDCAPGELVAVVGRVGSGKTTWASGLLGLMPCLKGHVRVGGTTAYVTQSPQILNDTIRENILFGSPMDEDWYGRVLSACCLDEDIRQFAEGELTQIGERGITISGGQKQRVAIARAAYSRADVIIFDDPLSAMDAHVGRRVFTECFLKLLSGASRVFFTNQLHFCKECSRVYMLEEGRVAEAGTYQQLVSRSPPGPFAAFMRSVVAEGADESDSAAQRSQYKSSDDIIKGEHAELVKTSPSGEPEAGAVKQHGRDVDFRLPGAVERETDEAEANKESSQASVSDNAGSDVQGAGNGKSELPAPERKAESEQQHAKVKRGFSMSRESKQSGRIGMKDAVRISVAANAAFLGAAVLLTNILSPALQYAVAVMLSLWTDALFDEHGQSTAAGAFEKPLPFILYLSVCGAFILSLLLRGAVTVSYFLRSSRVLHRAMLRSTLGQSMSWFDTTPVGRIMNRFGGDVHHMDMLLPMIFQMWTLFSLRILIAVIVAGVLAPPALLFGLLLLLLVRAVYRVYATIALEIQRAQMMALSPLLAAQSGFLGALDSIRCFGREGIFIERFHERQRAFIRTFYWASSLDRAVQSAFTTFGVNLFTGGVSAIVLALAIYESPFSKLVSPGKAGVVLSTTTMMGMMAPMVLQFTTRVETMMVAVQRVSEYKNLATEQRSRPRGGPLPASWPEKGYLCLDRVQMRYQEHLPLVLKGVTFEVKPGEKVGIVGRTGSGKSSVLLACFQMTPPPAGGAVRLDGLDLAAVPLLEARVRMGVIPQDSWLFSGTVRSNLDVSGACSDQELWAALGHAQLEGQARKWEKGLDHEVKEKGENLSNGTAQLLCLARVLLKKPRILFMDEATASVDSETDRMVQEAIRSPGVLPDGCTIVTIAHRLHTIIDYDRIVVMDHGEVVEEGPPDVLLRRLDGHLARLARDTGDDSAEELRRRADEASAAAAAGANHLRV